MSTVLLKGDTGSSDISPKVLAFEYESPDNDFSSSSSLLPPVGYINEVDRSKGVSAPRWIE